MNKVEDFINATKLNDLLNKKEDLINMTKLNELLNKKEAEALDKKVKRSGLNREAYLRQLISGVVPRDAPPPDYYSMMRELHKIGNNLNQIAQKAHVLNVIDVQRYDQEVWKFNEAVRKITEAVILPEKNESWQ